MVRSRVTRSKSSEASYSKIHLRVYLVLTSSLLCQVIVEYLKGRNEPPRMDITFQVRFSTLNPSCTSFLCSQYLCRLKRLQAFDWRAHRKIFSYVLIDRTAALQKLCFPYSNALRQTVAFISQFLSIARSNCRRFFSS